MESIERERCEKLGGNKDQETLEVEDGLRSTTMMIGARLRLAGL